MPNITRPHVEIISVDEFQAMVETARSAKIKEGMVLAGVSVDVEQHHPEEALIVAAIDDPNIDLTTEDKDDE